MNRWNIPQDLEAIVIARDQTCVYCRCDFTGAEGPRGQRRSWEHIINDASIVTEQNIALCCVSCNASKGAKTLRDWLESRFCSRRGITPTNLAEVAKAALQRQGGQLH